MSQIHASVKHENFICNKDETAGVVQVRTTFATDLEDEHIETSLFILYTRDSLR